MLNLLKTELTPIEQRAYDALGEAIETLEPYFATKCAVECERSFHFTPLPESARHARSVR